LVFDPNDWQPYAALSGVSLPVRVACAAGTGGAAAFDEDLLFTHRGLSGPAILQISSYWNPGETLRIDLSAGQGWERALLQAKQQEGRTSLPTVLGRSMPKRLAESWLRGAVQGPPHDRMAEWPDARLRQLAHSLENWLVHPAGTAGYKKAEVMRGGVDTDGLDQRTMQAKAVPGLYFIGECVDVTGWLGGYNFQWAWSSAAACGRALQGGP
jgi:predicted Rossmann fold flavoprotein